MIPKTATAIDDASRNAGLLQEGEIGALEVDAEVARGQRSDEEGRQKRPDSDRRGDAQAL